MASKISIAQDDIRHVLTVNGVEISYELLEAMTKSAADAGAWWRVVRVGDLVTVESRYDWDSKHAISH